MDPPWPACVQVPSRKWEARRGRVRSTSEVAAYDFKGSHEQTSKSNATAADARRLERHVSACRMPAYPFNRTGIVLLLQDVSLLLVAFVKNQVIL